MNLRSTLKDLSLNCRREYRPGDILFSTVAGGPAHVHSPQEFQHLSDYYNTSKTDRNTPGSLFNSLLDPNIELPTISVCEVDAVLGSLTTSSYSSLSTYAVDLSKEDQQHETFYQSAKNEIAGLSRSISPVARIDVDLTRDLPSKLRAAASEAVAVCTRSNNQYLPSSSRRAFSLNISSSCNNFGDSHQGRIVSTSRLVEPEINNEISRETVVSGSSAFLSTAIKAENEQQPLMGLHKIDSYASNSSSDSTGMLSTNGSIVSGPCNLESQPYARRPSLSVFRILPLIPVKSTASSPFVGLDLATGSFKKDVSSDNLLNDSVERRKANLSVRIANQAQLLLRTAVIPDSLISDFSKSHPHAEGLHQAPSNSGGSPKAVPSTNSLSQDQECCPSTSFDERFKYVCPYPHCGRRYQAQPSLLRHLSKYHGDPVELNQKGSNSFRQASRRSASEERKTVQDCDGLYRRTNSNSLISVPADGSPPESKTDKNLTPYFLSADGRLSECDSNTELRYKSQQPASSDRPVVLTRINQSAANLESLVQLNPTPQLLVPLNAVTAFDSIVIRQAENGHNPVAASTFSTDNSTTSVNPCVSSISPISGVEWSRHARFRSASGCHVVMSPLYGTPKLCSTQTGPQYPSFSQASSCIGHQDVHIVRPVESGCCSETGRRRTLSTGAAPHFTWISNGESDSRTAGNCDFSTCPSCGCGLAVSELGHREWMSGVRALTYSKNDSVCCPIDGCVYECQGRADLSAHLTSIHFPEVQNQLVRLIFACPVKDCQMVCADEKSFQAHFNRHLFGYLPGDLTGLFPPVPTGCVTDCNTLGDKITVSNSSSNADNFSNSFSYPTVLVPAVSPNTSGLKSVSVEALDTFSTATLSVGTQCVNPILRRVDPELQSFGSLSMTERPVLSDSSISSNTGFVGLSCCSQAFDCQTRSVQNGQTLSHDSQTRLNEWSNPSVVCSSSRTIPDPASVDLTDHRNLISALDLIPDDILMELLKEDRPGLWGDMPNANVSMHSAPYAWDSPNSDCFTSCPVHPESDKVGGVFRQTSDRYVADPNEQIEGSFRPNQLSLTDDADAPFESCSSSSALSSSTGWVPSSMVHQTWCLAVANERPNHSVLSDADLFLHGDRTSSDYECPRHVLSDLTAALVLPDVERRLKSSFALKKWANVATAPSRTPAQSDTSTMPRSVASFHSRVGRQACCSGKRRRNTSDSSPSFIHNEPSAPKPEAISVCNGSTGLALSQPQFTASSIDIVNLTSNNVVDTNLVARPGTSLSCPNKSPLHNSTAYFYAVSSPQTNPKAPQISETTGTHRTSRFSPKYSDLEPKKRRRNLLKSRKVTSSTLPIASSFPERNSGPPLLISKIILPRRHSMIYCSSVHPSTYHR